MKFGQLIKYNITNKMLIECNMRNIFAETSYAKWDGETIPRPFSQKLKLSVSRDQYSKVLYILLLLYGKLRAIEIYRN